MSLQKVSSNPNLLPFESAYSAPPSISNKTIEIFKEQGFTLPDSVVTLEGKVRDLNHVQAMLERAQQYTTKDKVISLLAMALGIGLITAGVLGTYYGAPILTGGNIVAIPTATLFLAFGLGGLYNYKWRDDDGRCVMDCENSFDFLLLSVIGPFIPVWKTFGDASRYQKAFNLRNESIETDKESAKPFFEDKQIQTQIADLLKLLIQEIDDTENELEEFKNKSITSSEVETALSARLNQLQTAEDQLKAIINYFIKG